ncbi:CvpA family protein [Marinobacterium sp. LSUCC0821]|jgi:membrane protein required for colicin V production|uniref:CvpA family protein n=1 Tax=Marinobacterium sp. LSUCC0821 TaxID=2668067 RepID=UPI0014514B8E|nr:CvpA family protein [Marinobacterium sp. LSUCC0821]QJD70937.1 CvpA family protein [Marinobacterium sp. LSUCC0821]
MIWTDWVILGIVGISALFSLKRGFVREALSLITWVSAFIIGRLFSSQLSIYLTDYIDTPSLRVLAAFGILFVLTLIAGSLVAMLVTALVSATGLSATDRILGMGFGVVRGGLLVVIIVMLLGMTPVTEDQWWQDSQLIPHFVLMEEWTKETAKQLGGAIWSMSNDSVISGANK